MDRFSSGRSHKKDWRYNTTIAPYLFVCPFLVIFLLFFLFPLLNSLVMSFQQVLPGERSWIGLKNYQSLFNPVFYKAILNSLLYMVWTLIVLIPVPLGLALLVHKSKLKGITFFKSVMFLPALTSVVVVSIVFKFIFGELPHAQLNEFLSLFGVEPTKWLRESQYVFPVLVTIASWRWMGVNMLYFLSGLASIPEEVVESAELEGAKKWQVYRYIVIPMLKPITIYVLTISIYAGLAMFTEAMMVYTLNTPKDMALTIVGYLYKLGVQRNNMGLASAVGVFLLLFALMINLMQLKMSGFFNKDEQ